MPKPTQREQWNNHLSYYHQPMHTMKDHFCLLFITFCWLYCSGISGQLIMTDTPCGSLQADGMMHLQAGVPLSMNVTISAPFPALAGGSWSRPVVATPSANCGTTFGPSVDGQSFNIGGNLTATFAGGAGTPQVTISSGGQPLLEGSYDLPLRLATGSNTYVRNFRFIVRKPLDVVFVLDRSGSMECDTDEDSSADWPACSTGNTAGGTDGRRWDRLAAAMDGFIAKFDRPDTLTSVGGDRIGIVYFSGVTNSLQTFGNDATGMNQLSSLGVGTAPIGATPLLSELNTIGSTQLGRDGTSIGAGLVKAVNDRLGGGAPATRRQVIVLFTDGEQNRGNRVKESGAGMGRIVRQSANNASPVLLDLNPLITAGLEVMTVSTVTTGPVQLLTTMADKGSNAFTVPPGQEDRFAERIATEVFNAILSAYSPRLVARQIFTPGNGTTTLRFPLNAGVNRAHFEAFFSNPLPNARAARLKLYHDGTEVTRLATTGQTRYSLTATLPFYALDDGRSEGQWMVVVEPRSPQALPPGTQVSVSATADDHAIRFAADVAEDKLVVGAPFRPTLRLTEDGNSVTNAIVTATITRPGEDLGHLLARTHIGQLPKTTTESASCADLKYGWLRANQPKALRKYLDLQTRTITLAYVGNDRYEGYFRDTDVTGNYEIRYDVRYDSPRRGRVQRSETQSRYVGFLEVDLGLELRESRQSEGQLSRQKYRNLTTTPTYRVNGQRRFVGPGFARSFGTDNERVTISASDNCDGSYAVSASGPNNEKFTLYLLDREVFTGTVRSFNEGGKKGMTYLALSGGVTRVGAGFAASDEDGFYGQLGLGRRFGGRFGGELTAGYYGFADNDAYLLGGTAWLNGYLTRGSLDLMLGVGPGYYLPQGENATLGGAVRAVAFARFGGLSLGLEAGYFRLADPEFDFTTLGLRAALKL